MKLVLAQGNPGNMYTSTRHNVGWELLDALAGTAEFQTRAKFFAAIAEKEIAGEKVLLVKPSTFYNETGRAARALLDFYKLDPSDMLVLHDDIALPFGAIRIRQKGSDAGNNGIKSLNAHVGYNYWRLRIGIWRDIYAQRQSSDLVLARFSSEEQTFISTMLVPEIRVLVEQFCAGTLIATSKLLVSE